MNCTEANREFQCSCLLIKALLQYLSAPERKKVHEWLKKLNDLGDDLPDANIRKEYTSCLLINVQNGRLSAPFNLVPPCGKIRPLSRILPEHLYDDMMKQNKLNYCFTSSLDCQPDPPVPAEALNTDPTSFRKEQPRPRKGIIAHCTAFSNYNES